MSATETRLCGNALTSAMGAFLGERPHREILVDEELGVTCGCRQSFCHQIVMMIPDFILLVLAFLHLYPVYMLCRPPVAGVSLERY